MQPSWKIPEEIERPFRDGLDHAAKRRAAELHALVNELSTQQLAGIIQLSCYVTAYTAIDVVDRRWPTDAHARRMAQRTAEGGTTSFAEFGVTEENVYLFISRCALGSTPYEDVFADIFPDPTEFFAAVFFITVKVLAAFTPKGKDMGEFLDLMEAALEGAWLLDLNLLPALMFRARLPQEALNPKANEASS